MTREEHLAFCRRCKNRAFSATEGTICGITNRIADFEVSCPNYRVDESVPVEDPAKALEETYIKPDVLSADARQNLSSQQHVVYGVIGGASSAILGALLWTLVTVTTNHQIGYMAIGIGFIVGFGVRFFGAGIDKYFGIIGAVFALLGCLLGNLLSQVYFIAEAENLGYFDTLTLLSPSIILSIFEESGHPMDLLFYGLAITAGYRYAFRKITEDVLKQAEQGLLPPPPFSSFRNVGVIVLFLSLSMGGYFIYSASGGIRTFYYTNGSIQSKGQLSNGKEHGYWEMWWENGTPMANGYFTNGIPDSIWNYYTDEGEHYRTGKFKKGLKHGTWTDYYPNRQIAFTGNYEDDRQSGLWIYYYEDGTKSGSTLFYLDNPDGKFESFNPDGTPNTLGMYTRGKPTGAWLSYYPDGKKMLETEFETETIIRIINSWNSNGTPEVINGEGIYKGRNEEGKVVEMGIVKGGYKTGNWTTYFASGNTYQVGEFKDNLYYLRNSWDSSGKPMVLNSNGYHEQYEDDRGETVKEYGLIRNGLREEKWEVYYPTGVIAQETTFVKGLLEGPQSGNTETGALYFEGICKNNERTGLWTWYHDNGKKSSTVTFVQGKKEGDQIFYDEDEIPIKIEVYKNGELVAKKII
jgi:antitoxin component YwqK of YwqJK toxin-antitoxin module